MTPDPADPDSDPRPADRGRQAERPGDARPAGPGTPVTAPRLRVVVTDGRGRAVRADPLPRWLADVAPRRARGEVAVALVGDRTMRRLNHRYRGVDRATDVLAFPVAPDGDDMAGGEPQAGSLPHLGDIAIATGVATRQAHDAGHPLGVELRRLALHGLLHLLGYDHERDTGQMARLERRLRRAGGLA